MTWNSSGNLKNQRTLLMIYNYIKLASGNTHFVQRGYFLFKIIIYILSLITASKLGFLSHLDTHRYFFVIFLLRIIIKNGNTKTISSNCEPHRTIWNVSMGNNLKFLHENTSLFVCWFDAENPINFSSSFYGFYIWWMLKGPSLKS